MKARHSSLSKAARIIFLVLCLFAGPAHAYTTTTCEETWYVPTPGKEFSGSTASWTKVKEGDCQSHSMKLLELWNSGHSESFAMVDGKGYYVKLTEVPEGPGCHDRGAPVIDPQCFLPDALRHYEVHKERQYYQVTSGRELKLLDESSVKGGTAASGCKPGLYASDGVSLFYATHAFDDESGVFPYTPVRIEGADLASFKCFTPTGSNDDHEWAHDKDHVFYFGRTINGMSPNFPVRVQGDPRSVTSFIINGDKVFEVSWDEVTLRPDMKPDLHLLSPNFMTDGTSVFDREGKKIQGLNAAALKIVMPVCPIPGYPQLNCTPYDSTIPTGMVLDGGIAIENGVIAFPRFGSHVFRHEGLNAGNVTYFFLKRDDAQPDAFMIFDNRLYRLRALVDQLSDYDARTQQRLKDGVVIHGSLRSAKCGFVDDDKGPIDMETLERYSPDSPYPKQNC
jgi:hypothetical protein